MDASVSCPLRPPKQKADGGPIQPPKPRRLQRTLPHLSMEPLNSPTIVDTPSANPPTDSFSQWTSHSSYIADRSAPTTPGILSRSPSALRLNSAKSLTHLSFAADAFSTDASGTDLGAKLAKSKSTTLLLPTGSAQSYGNRRRRKVGPVAAALTASSSAKPATNTSDDGEWFFRAGALITSEARESKGQSWLVSRASSTSLVAMDDDDESGVGYDGSDYRDGRAFSTRASRNASRAASTRTSRRPSGVGGSRPDLTFLTPASARTPTRELASATSSHGDYFGETARTSSTAAMGPDFVDELDEDDEEDIDTELRLRLEEAEVARLAQDRGFGLGGLVDRLMGWTLFDVKEDEAQEAEEDEAQEGQRELRKTKSAPAREQTGHISQAALPGGGKSGGVVEQRDGGQAREDNVEGQGGWKDAAWLLSVASKVLL